MGAMLAAYRQRTQDVTTKTNSFGETEIIGGHDKFFALWPVHFRQNNGIGMTTGKLSVNWPLYIVARSPTRFDLRALAVFTWIDDREKKYHEWEGRIHSWSLRAARAKPHARIPFVQPCAQRHGESDFISGPCTNTATSSRRLDRERTRILFICFQV